MNSSNHTDIARLKILIFVGHTSTSFLYKILSLFLDSTIPKKIFIISSYQKNVDGFQNEILWLHQPILLIYFRTKKMHRNILLILLHATFKKRIIINLAKNKPSLQVFTIIFIIKKCTLFYNVPFLHLPLAFYEFPVLYSDLTKFTMVNFVKSMISEILF